MLLIALVLGVVAGLRSMVAPAAVSWAARIGLLALFATPLAFLSFSATPFIFTLLAVGEIINDKRPLTPRRTIPVQLGGRLLSGAFVGAAIALPSGQWIVGLIVGVVGALIGTYGGAAVRGRLAHAFGRDLPAAAIEDVTAVLLSAVAVWRIG